MDLVPTKSAIRAIGDKQQQAKWLTTPFGVFAGAFPGFVAGYFFTNNGVFAEAGSIYLTIFIWSVASYVLTRLFVYALGWSAGRTTAPQTSSSKASWAAFGQSFPRPWHSRQREGPGQARGPYFPKRSDKF